MRRGRLLVIPVMIFAATACTSTPQKTRPVLDPFGSSSTYLAPAGNRTAAEAILHNNDVYYQTEFNQGVTVVLARGNPGSFGPFIAWRQKATADLGLGDDAFKQADAQFNADDEPASISNWRYDNTALSGDVGVLANDGLDVGGPDDAQARQKVQGDMAQFHTDYATAEQDASDVGAGR